MSVSEESADKAWVDRWVRCQAALESVRRRELREFEHTRNAHIIDGLLQLGHDLAVPRGMTGLVEQQRLFQRTRS